MTRPHDGASLLSFIALVASCAVITSAACDQTTLPRLDSSPVCDGLDLSTLAPGDRTAQLVVNGLCRDFRLHIPAAWSALGADPLPLVIALHGYTGTAAGLESGSGLSRKADQAGFVAVYPQALGNPPSWFTSPGSASYGDLAFLHALITQLGVSPRIDRRRVYVTGFSQGGTLASRAACELSDVVTAIAPMSGSYQGYTQCAPSRPVPIISIHGGSDTTIPLEGQPSYGAPPIRDWIDWWVVRNACRTTPVRESPAPGVAVEAWEGCEAGARVTLIVIEGQGHTWPRTDTSPPMPIDGTDTIWTFLAQQRLPE